MNGFCSETVVFQCVEEPRGGAFPFKQEYGKLLSSKLITYRAAE